MSTSRTEAFGREIRLRLARSEIMDWLGALSAKDSGLAKEACRALAARYRLDAERQRSPIVRAFAIESAEKFERMAAELERRCQGSA